MRTLTLRQAKNLKYGDILHHNVHRNVDGTCSRWRVSGEPKVWKRSPERVKVPIKHGMYDNDYIDEITLFLVHLERNCTRKG